MLELEKNTIVLLSAIILLLLLSDCTGKKSRQKDYPIKPVPFTAVKMTDNFWAPRIRINHEVTIPIALKQSEETGRIQNFKIAGGHAKGKFCSIYPFDDSDVFKIIEGASYSLQTFPDPELEAYLDTLIFYIGDAQEEDGYIYTIRTIMGDNSHPWIGSKRWELVHEGSHELYNLGHMYEAAVAHYQATGKRNFLDIAIKSADLVDHDFGWGKIEDYPGHQEIEIGLVKLYRATGEKKYLDLAKFFLDVRGPNGEEYNQADKKVIDQTEAVGHAVRAGYMYSGMADVAALTGDASYAAAIKRIWEDVVYRKLYITGGVGATGGNEGFAGPWNLPNMSAYCETCASIANVFWNHRMFSLTGDVRYIDVLERTLYNGLLSGISLSGDLFFYPNPLESYGQHERSPWFGCACCPSNLCRFIPSVPGYLYSTTKDRIYVNIYASNTALIKLDDNNVEIIQETNYPWGGKVSVILNPEKPGKFRMMFRIPGWARNEVVPGDLYGFKEEYPVNMDVFINGQSIKYAIVNGYILIRRNWSTGDKIEFEISMPVRQVQANEKVEADIGRLAIQRGPLVYCAEWPDNPGGHVLNLMFDSTVPLQSSFHEELLDGTAMLEGTAEGTRKNVDGNIEIINNQEITLIPYHLWANRGAGEMMVWLPLSVDKAKPLPAETIASKSKISASKPTRALHALNDQFEPAHSNDPEVTHYHWWPDKDTIHWVQYDFEKTSTVSTVKVYWFDDRPDGGCALPDAWEVLYRSGNKWLPVNTKSGYPITKDEYNVVSFDQVKTSALRLNVKLSKEYSGGILEWIVE